MTSPENPGIGRAIRWAFVLVVTFVLMGVVLWVAIPAITTTGITISQMLLLSHLMSEMGLDERLQQALIYGAFTLLAISAPYCFSRGKYGFRHASAACLAMVALSYVIWYVKDEVFDTKPLDITSPYVQEHAFDRYSHKSNLCWAKGVDGQVEVFWKTTAGDPYSGYSTTEFTPEYYATVLNQRLAEQKKDEEQARQDQDLSNQVQAQLQQRADQVNDLQAKLKSASDQEQGDQVIIKDQAGRIADTQAKAQLLAERENQDQTLLTAKSEEALSLQAKVQKCQDSLDGEREKCRNLEQTVADQASRIAPETPSETSDVTPPTATTETIAPPPVVPIAHELRPGLYLNINRVEGQTTFWSDGPVEVRVPNYAPRVFQPGQRIRISRDLLLVKIYPLSPEATTLWQTNAL